MLKTAVNKTAAAPTPMAGLALGIASLGWCWENAVTLNGKAQWVGAILASVLLFMLLVKFVFHNHLLRDELAHPVVGSVAPTFAMALMVVSHSVGQFSIYIGDAIWLAAVALHVVFLVSFIYHRATEFRLHHMVPSWFVPPVGLIVADVSFSGTALLAPVAEAALLFGLVSYGVMLPVMVYRLVFCEQIPDTAKPTIAIMAAPASLSMAGYLTITEHPSPILIALLFGIAVLMTFVTYLSFLHLMRLSFSASFAAFTFPTVISATALFKMAVWLESVGVAQHYCAQVSHLALFELLVATLVVGYVSVRYVHHYLIPGKTH